MRETQCVENADLFVNHPQARRKKISTILKCKKNLITFYSVNRIVERVNGVFSGNWVQ